MKRLLFYCALILLPCPGFGGVAITAFPYVNNFESQGDVDDAEHVASEDCVGTITYESASGWGSTGAFKLRINDHYAVGCQTYEDTSGMGTFSWASLGGQTQMNIGFLAYFGSNFDQPLDNDDMVKFVLWHATDTGRPMMALRHYGGGIDHKIWAACDDAGGLCADEFGDQYPNDEGTPIASYGWQFDDRREEWVWLEFESVIDGNNSIYIYTQDGDLAGLYAYIATNEAGATTYDAYNETGYWEGASSTTDQTYVMFDVLTIDNEFIGPPDGFLESSPAAGSGMGFFLGGGAP